MTALISGTYTISSLVGNDTFFLHFRDSAPGSPLRGRPYSGSNSQHWEISPTRLPNYYAIRNSLYQMQVTFPGPDEVGQVMESGNDPRDWYIIPAETGYVVSLNVNRSLVWNIAGGQTVDHAHIILYGYSDLAENELWHIRPVELDGEPSSANIPSSSSLPASESSSQSSAAPSSGGSSPSTTISTISSSSVTGSSASSETGTTQDGSNSDIGAAGSYRLQKIYGVLGLSLALPALLAFTSL